MIDYINYYFDLYPKNINKVDEKYEFYINSEKYSFVLYTRNFDEINELVKLNKEMILNGSLVHEIMINKFGKALNNYEGKVYVLLRIYINENKKIDITDIIEFLNEGKIINQNSILLRTNWASMWESKIDYFEYQMGHVLKKYRITYNIMDYYVGLSENAILYLKSIVPKYQGKLVLGVSHKRIGVNSTLYDLYNPLEFIIDFKVSDIAEYIKDILLHTNNINMILDELFSKYYLDKLNLSLLISRILYPSNFFDMFDNILINKLTENKMLDLTKKSSSIENFICEFIEKYNLYPIEWLRC